MLNPTGRQFELTLGGNRAVITQVAAAIRELTIGGVHVTEPYAADERAPFGDGTVLVPWPNRVRDGVWYLDGRPQQLDLTEPARLNALHGLLVDRPYEVVSQTADTVVLAATIFPTRGYPFELATTVAYTLVADGLTVTHGFHAIGDRATPVAVGTHPFFRVGDVPTDELTLTLNAGTRFETDARLNPTAETPVLGTPYDLRGGVRVAELELDDAFGEVAFDGDRAAHRLTAPDGRWVELWQGPDFGFVQVFTTRIFPRGGELGRAIAVEPMTAPPDALNSGRGLRWLEPGERWELSWGIRYSGES